MPFRFLVFLNLPSVGDCVRLPAFRFVERKLVRSFASPPFPVFFFRLLIIVAFLGAGRPTCLPYIIYFCSRAFIDTIFVSYRLINPTAIHHHVGYSVSSPNYLPAAVAAGSKTVGPAS